MEKLEKLLAGKPESHVMPFLWVHGEPHERYAAQLDAMEAAGIREFCVEARPHPDFGGPGWFSDLGFLLEEAKRRGMAMWLLDESHFPTGSANGEVKKHHPELQKRYLRLATFDVCGPLEGAELNLRYTAASPTDEILAVLACRRCSPDEPDVTQTVDLTPTLHARADYETGKPVIGWDGKPMGFDQGPCPVVDLDLGEGLWYVNVLYTSFGGGEKETEGYLNPIDPAATQVLVDTVYEPVFEHFADDFGTTFKGFFSDEPRFGNIHGAEDASIGRNPQMVLPWRADLARLLAERLQSTSLAGLDEESVLAYLPLLFFGDCEAAHVVRFAYMDLVSELYSECFDGVLGRWCEAHGVERIGHVIEDNNAATRLGYGPGHYFRALAHASMAGVDVVMEQLMPGYDEGFFRGFHKPGWEMAFFTYVLGKLGGSLAHLNEATRGRCMAEVFGAYGWEEGNKLGKWMIDYMLSRGVNYFVPHAFDTADFPDPDCPPHLAPWGHNPQTGNFGELMAYTQRLSTLLSGGYYRPQVALWFNAEAEWSGDWQKVEEPARAMGRAQIEYDLVSTDYLCDDCMIVHDAWCFVCGKDTFNALVLPWAEAMPRRLLERALDIAESVAPVFFVGALPTRTSEGDDAAELLAELASSRNVVVVRQEDLAPALIAAELRELTPSMDVPWLRTYSYGHRDGLVYLLVNEHPSLRVACELTGAVEGHTYVYDAFENTLVEDPRAFEIDLAPYGSKIVIVSRDPIAGAVPAPEPFVEDHARELGACELSLAPMEEGCRAWAPIATLERPAYVSELEGLDSFCGLIRYAFAPELTAEEASGRVRLTLEGVQEGATVIANGERAGTKIVGDYAFDLTGRLHEDENELVVELDTTLGRAMDDFIGQVLPLLPTGMKGARLAFA